MLITYKPFAVAAGSGFPGGGPLSNLPCMGPRFLSGAYPPRTFRFHKRHVERANYMHGLRSLASNLYLCELESGHKQGANDRRGQGSRAFYYKRPTEKPRNLSSMSPSPLASGRFFCYYARGTSCDEWRTTNDSRSEAGKKRECKRGHGKRKVICIFFIMLDGQLLLLFYIQFSNPRGRSGMASWTRRGRNR